MRSWKCYLMLKEHDHKVTCNSFELFSIEVAYEMGNCGIMQCISKNSSCFKGWHYKKDYYIPLRNYCNCLMSLSEVFHTSYISAIFLKCICENYVLFICCLWVSGSPSASACVRQERNPTIQKENQSPL